MRLRLRRGRKRRPARPAFAVTPTARAALLAAWISAGKVILFTVGSASFLADRPAAEMAWVYLGLALLAAGSAIALAPWLERLQPVRSLAWLLLSGLAATAVLALGLVLGLPGTAGALLILAHLYNIASEILLWLVAATWLPAPELRRATVWICLAAALGGCGGGLAVERLLLLGEAATLVMAVFAAAMGALWALGAGERAIRPTASAAMALEEEPTTDAPQVCWQEVLSHPLGVPLGAAALLLTLVWSLTEFLCLARYQQAYPPDELGRQLAWLFAVLQLVEFACILLLSGPVTRWISPAWRSALFPLGALLTLQLLGGSLPQEGDGQPAIWPVLLAHAYTEAASNALFDPVHASNFAAVPARLQARLRTFSDGICYPLGMAAGALVLLSAQDAPDSLPFVLLLATTAAVFFVGVGLFTGAMIGRSLLSELGLTAEVGTSPLAAELKAAKRALGPWVRRTALRDRLLAARRGARRFDEIHRRVDRADRRALRIAFAWARRCDPGGPTARLETLLDSRNAERRALVVEAVLSLPLRGLFLPLLPALRRRYRRDLASGGWR